MCQCLTSILILLLLYTFNEHINAKANISIKICQKLLYIFVLQLSNNNYYHNLCFLLSYIYLLTVQLTYVIYTKCLFPVVWVQNSTNKGSMQLPSYLCFDRCFRGALHALVTSTWGKLEKVCAQHIQQD